LPGYEYVTVQWKPLTQMQAGEKLIIRRIHETAEDDVDLMQFLENNGVFPGTQVDLCEVLPFNQTLTLCVDERRVVLGFPAAQYIYVEIVGE